MAAPDTIFISGLKVQAILGVLPREREQPQSVVFDIELHTDITRAAASKNLEHTVDYAQVAALAQQLAIEGKYLLVESLIEELAQTLLQQFPESIESVQISVSKPDAVENTDAVGVKIHRPR